MDHHTRQCPGCGYDLRGRSLDSEFCPECGAFLARFDSGEPAAASGLVLRRTLQADDRGILVRNATLPAALVERHLAAASRHAEIWYAIGISGLIFSAVGCIFAALVLHDRYLLPDLPFEHPFISLGFLTGVHYLAYRYLVKGWLIDRVIQRRVRRTLNREGYRLCRHCGWLFDEETRQLESCPHCHRTREADAGPRHVNSA